MHYEAGGVRDLLQAIYAAIFGAGTGSVNSMFGVKDAEVDNDQTFGVLITDLSGAIVQATAIAPGTIAIHRVRANVDTEIVAATAASEAAGRVYYTYGFPNASWAVGDIYYLVFSGIVVTTIGDTFSYPDLFYWGRVTSEEATLTVVQDNQAKLTSATYGLAALKALIDTVDTVVDGIDTDTNSLIASLADGTNGLAAIKTAIGTRAAASDITAAHATTDGLITTVDTVVDAIKLKTDGLNFTGTDVKATLDGEAVTASSVTDKTGYSISGTKTTLDALQDISTASVNTEVDNALNTQVPASPTAGSLNDILSKAAGGNTFSKATDSLEAIRDLLDDIQDGSQTIQTIYNLAASLSPPRSSTGSTLLMDGTEKIIYEVSSAPGIQPFIQGYVLLPGVGSGSTTINTYVKVSSGGSYYLKDTGTFAHTTDRIVSIPWSQSTAGLPTFLRNVYGVKVTATQTAGVNQTLTFVFMLS